MAPIAACALLAGCFSPDLDGQIACTEATGCPPGLTCVSQVCVGGAQALDAQPTGDGAVVDAALDDAEAGTMDGAAHDGKPPVDAEICNNDCNSCNGFSCCEEECQGGNCSASCDNLSCDCNIDCRQISDCNLSCNDSNCDFDCREAGNCTVACDGNSTCAINCEDASNCMVECKANAVCQVDCQTAGNCEFTQCNNPTTCPNSVIVCNKPCP